MAFDFYKKEIIGDVTRYVRPCKTISLGPLSGPNSFTISEEQVTILPDLSVTTVQLGTAELQATITDPNQTFNTLDPVTGAITGTMTFGQLKVLMFSLYVSLGLIRDQG